MKKAAEQKRTVAMILSIFALSGLLIACGSSGGDSAGTPFSSANGAYQCYGGVCPIPIQYGQVLGFYAQTSNFYIPGYQNNGSTLNIKPGMNNVLQEAMGVCNREYYSGGYAACTTWYSGAHDLVLLAEGGSESANVKLIIRTIPGNLTNGASWYSYSAPNFQSILMSMVGFPVVGNQSGVYDPMVLNATIWPTNNSQGFEVRANGPRISSSWNKLFQFQVAAGKLEDSAWNFRLYYNSSMAMEGKAIRCQSQYCGMDRSYFNASGY